MYREVMQHVFVIIASPSNMPSTAPLELSFKALEAYVQEA
jgi:hypothetical protein